MEGAFFAVPGAVILLCAALFLMIFDARRRSPGGILTYAGAACALASAALAILGGAGLFECAAVLLALLLVWKGAGR
ncbi:MAG: hypothetical protein II794_03140 [Oscillospiraceae bacterium]|nr:hypothetical protein [Oscillospiraceae bacterium]